MSVFRGPVAGLALVAGLSLASAVSAQDLSAIPSGTYKVDPTHAYINFKYNHLGFSNPTLAFDEFDIEVDLNVEDVTQSSVSVTIDPASVVAGSDVWKDHLVGENWFNVAEHPEITFVSTSVAAADGGLEVQGDLTIKGTSQAVTLAVAINGAGPHPRSGDPILGIEATSDVLRSAFGMERGAPFVSDEIAISATAELVGPKP